MRLIRAGIALTLVLMLSGCGAASETTSAPPSPKPAPVEVTQSKAPPVTAEVPQSLPEPAAESESTPQPDPGKLGSSAVTFISVTDGDTVVTSAGKVRIIGIDTPERGQCGFDQAAGAIDALLSAGDPVILEAAAGLDDQDRYDRLLRYVITDKGIDVGLMQLKAGNAVARYDSTDGYPRHPRETEYHNAQIATTTPSGGPIVPGCEASAPPVAPPANSNEWWTQYGSCSKLKKNTNGHPTGPFSANDPSEVAIYNWFAYGTGHRGDGDGDGLACE